MLNVAYTKFYSSEQTQGNVLLLSVGFLMLFLCVCFVEKIILMTYAVLHFVVFKET